MTAGALRVVDVAELVQHLRREAQAPDVLRDSIEGRRSRFARRARDRELAPTSAVAARQRLRAIPEDMIREWWTSSPDEVRPAGDAQRLGVS